MRKFLIVLDWGRKVQIHLFRLEKETSCTYQKEKMLEQKEILEWIEASILVVRDVRPRIKLISKIWKDNFDQEFGSNMDWKHTYHNLTTTR